MKDKFNEYLFWFGASCIASFGLWMTCWEFYQTEPADEFGVTFGFMTNCPCPEWGSQHEAELHDIAGVIAEKYDLWELAPPQGWEWLEKEN